MISCYFISLEVPSPNIVTLEVRALTYELGNHGAVMDGEIQSVLNNR